MKALITSEYSKAFWYGFLSVLSLGIVPSYLHRMPQVSVQANNETWYKIANNGIYADCMAIAMDMVKTSHKYRRV